MFTVLNTNGDRLDNPFIVTGSDFREVFIYLGDNISETLDGTVKIVLINERGNLTTLKEVSSLTDKDDRASRFILPAGSKVDVILSLSTATDLYAEITTGIRLS